MGKLTVLIGLPRSGKSTYAQNWLKYGKNRVVVSEDKIRLALTGQDYCGPAEEFVHSIYYTMIKTLLMDYDVLADDTHTTVGSLRKLAVLDDFHYEIMDTPVDVCIQRAKDTGRPYLEGVIRRLGSQLADITPEVIEECKRWAKDNEERFKAVCKVEVKEIKEVEIPPLKFIFKDYPRPFRMPDPLGDVEYPDEGHTIHYRD